MSVLELHPMNTTASDSLRTSLREIPPELTLRNAIPVSRLVGISRVVDVTAFDRLGLPVYLSLRPGAKPFCVFAGKGLRAIDSKVSAYMEAIETSFAAYGQSPLELVPATVSDVLGASRKDAILDLCPLMNARIRSDSFLSCVKVEELFSGESVLVPAELVFCPSPRPAHEMLFKSAFNGLSSGNSLVEASLHGLLEVIERDALSFHYVRDETRLVPLKTLPQSFHTVLQALELARVDLYLRSVPNEFDIPVFTAFMVDSCPGSYDYMATGSGCHIDPVIAAIRAICEAAQARVCFAYGCCPEWEDLYRALDVSSRDGIAMPFRASVALTSDPSNSLPFSEVPRPAPKLSVNEAWAFLTDLLNLKGFNRICRVIYTDNASPFQVVRMIVPKMEFFSLKLHRVGPRLKRLAASI